MTSPTEPASENIVFFDGVCSLCNGFIDFLIKRDSKRIFHYAPLQGHTANERLPMSRVKVGTHFTSIIYLRNGQMLSQSDAVLKILADLGGVWSLTSLLRIFPKTVRDTSYSLIATNRYKWFGRRETCRVPTKEERSTFLN